MRKLALSLPHVLSILLIVDVTSLSGSNPTLRVVSSKRDTPGSESETFFFDEGVHQPVAPSNKSTSRVAPDLRTLLRSTFLPSGYPDRTPVGYLHYSFWSWVQDLSTQLRSVVATQRILEGVGVGSKDATSLSALMNFLVRDGCGMAATLSFTSIASSRFRTDLKRWRLFADLMVDVGITLEVAATQVPPSLFLFMISVGNMCKAVCGVAAGACGGAINLHWARGSDIADITSKFGAQHTVTGSLGLIFAALFARSVSKLSQRYLWGLYSTLTVIHIVANMRCMKLVAFDSFNHVRLNMVASEFLSWWKNPQVPKLPGTLAVLSTPHQISMKEPLFFLAGRKRTPVPVQFGQSFNDFFVTTGKSRTTLKALLTNNTENYVISSGTTRKGTSCVAVALHAAASPLDEAKAFFHAILLGDRLTSGVNDPTHDQTNIEDSVQEEMSSAWDLFYNSCCEAGWDISRTELPTLGYEIETRSSQ